MIDINKSCDLLYDREFLRWLKSVDANWHAKAIDAIKNNIGCSGSKKFMSELLVDVVNKHRDAFFNFLSNGRQHLLTRPMVVDDVEARRATAMIKVFGSYVPGLLVWPRRVAYLKSQVEEIELVKKKSLRFNDVEVDGFVVIEFLLPTDADVSMTDWLTAKYKSGQSV